MERSPSHNTAIKFHQGSLHADCMSPPVHYKIPSCKHKITQLVYYHTYLLLLSASASHNINEFFWGFSCINAQENSLCPGMCSCHWDCTWMLFKVSLGRHLLQIKHSVFNCKYSVHNTKSKKQNERILISHYSLYIRLHPIQPLFDDKTELYSLVHSRQSGRPTHQTEKEGDWNWESRSERAREAGRMVRRHRSMLIWSWPSSR